MQHVNDFDHIDMKYLYIRAKASLIMFLVLLSNLTQAQDIAVLPSDPAVKSGALPNGTKWYVASNSYVKGIADFAVVQLTGYDTVQGVGRDSIVALSREALASQPLLLSPSVQDFFISKGSLPGPEGFAEVDEDATIFRFRHVNVSQSESVLDSVLLVLVNMVGRCSYTEDCMLKKWYAPSDQAIIVVGDVDAKVVAEKLKMLSYMIPSSESQKRKGYEWTDRKGIAVEIDSSGVEGIAEVKASWRLQRTPKELMNTVMPVTYARYMTMAGEIARRRISATFMRAGIPMASVESAYSGGSGTLGDEEFYISVKVAPEHVEDALYVIAGTVSAMDASGAEIHEIMSAGHVFADALYAWDRGKDVRNSEYLDRCICSFVYNSPLSSRKDIRHFHQSKVLDVDMERNLFHSIVSSSLDGSSNLKLSVSSEGLQLDEDAVRAIFVSAWQNPEKTVAECHEPELAVTAPELKVKVKSSKKEYLSKGYMLTLSNGIRIICKEMPSDEDVLHYSLSLNGGTGNMTGLCPEDGGYLEDFFWKCSIGGVSGQSFRDAVRRQGVTLECKVGHSCTEFKGRVPHERLDYLFKVLMTMMNDRKVSDAEWEYYLRCEPLRQLSGCASGHKECLGDGFDAKADEFFKTLSGKINDGVIVLAGRIDEKKLKEIASVYAGGFITSDRVFTRTETYSGGMAGKSGVYRKGFTGKVNVQISAPMPLTAENYYASALASMVLKRNLSVASAGMGIQVDVTHECRRHPQEVLVLTVSMNEVSVDGFARGTAGYSKDNALAAVREVLSDMSGVKVDDALLASYRYRLERSLQLEKENPEYWIEAVRMRYMEGKDFTTGAEARIKALTADNVRRILSSLDGGTRVEYTITER